MSHWKNESPSKYYAICIAPKDGGDDYVPWFVTSYADDRCDEQTRDHVGVLDTVQDDKAEDDVLIAALHKEFSFTIGCEVEVRRER
jgi:hypothetical protein